MSSIIENLRRFNCHERFYVVGWALGNRAFTLDPCVRDLIGQRLNLSIPSDAFVAMDYTLDWLYASIFLHEDPAVAAIYELDKHLRATVEDVDLLIAYDDGPRCQIVMLEAKGRTQWSNKQLQSKAARLGPLFEHSRAVEQHVTPHFVIASPREPQRLRPADLPTWMRDERGRIPWIALPLPEDLLRVERCGASRKPSKDGPYWTVRP